jgi:ketosteroid isomerase-like protein
MKISIRILGFILVATGLGTPLLGVSENKDVSDLLAADNAFAQAAVGDNVDQFASYMTDDFVMLWVEPQSPGAPAHWVATTKNEWVDSVRSHKTRYLSVELRHQTVHLQGSIATLTGEYSQTAVQDGKEKTESGSYAETWNKKGGRWVIVNSVFP